MVLCKARKWIFKKFIGWYGSGEFKQLDKETIAYCLMSIGQFLGMRWGYWEEKDVPEDVFEAAMSLIFEGLRKR